MTPLEALIRTVPDFPQPGVLFRDITPLLANAAAFRACADRLAEPWRDAAPDAVCAIEARGFLFGIAVAERLGVGFVPLRKPGKLPPPVIALDYRLEYGSARLEARRDLLAVGARVLLIDDLLATGGTLHAASSLIERLDAAVIGAAVVVELGALGGRRLWNRQAPLRALIEY